MEGTDVETYFPDSDEFPVGDPYEKYYEQNWTIPNVISHHCVPRINVYVQVYDDSCFDICPPGEDPKTCSVKHCSPLTPLDGEITVDPQPQDSIPSKFVNARPTKTLPFKTYTTDMGIGKNVFTRVRYPGLHTVQCSLGKEKKKQSGGDAYLEKHFKTRCEEMLFFFIRNFYFVFTGLSKRTSSYRAFCGKD